MPRTRNVRGGCWREHLDEAERSISGVLATREAQDPAAE